MKKVIATVFCFPLLAVAISASADYRPYISIGAGYAAAQDMPNSSDFGGGTHTDDNYGGRAVIGLLWNPESNLSYGVETGAAYYGYNQYSYENVSLDYNYYGIELLGVLQFNLDKVHFLLKAGATDEMMHPTQSGVEIHGNQLSNIDGNNQVLPEVGAGLMYAATENLQIGLTYYHTFGNTVSFDSTADAENLPSIDMALLEFSYLI